MSIQVALSIAGSDSGGGAGVQADLKTFSVFGVYGVTAITAVTAQNTCEVKSVYALCSEIIAEQIDAVFADFDVAAVKLGMLGNVAAVKCVSERLVHYDVSCLVVDPVMAAESGGSLIEAEALHLLRTEIIPLADVLTPNLPEAAQLLELKQAEVIENPLAACHELYNLGAKAVVLKGGHGSRKSSNDYFFDGSTVRILEAERVKTENTHGTGCTFASAITAGLALGLSTFEATVKAKAYVLRTIQAADSLSLGNGHGPVHHFVDCWNKV